MTHGSAPSATTERAVRHLVSVLDGRLILPGDARYDAARSVYFTGIDRRPNSSVPGPGPALPPRTVLFEASAERIWVAQADELGLRSVVRYRVDGLRAADAAAP